VPTFITCQQPALSPESAEAARLTMNTSTSQACFVFENIPGIAFLEHRQLSGGTSQGHRSSCAFLPATAAFR